jgi:hypothetical protein
MYNIHVFTYTNTYSNMSSLELNWMIVKRYTVSGFQHLFVNQRWNAWSRFVSCSAWEHLKEGSKQNTSANNWHYKKMITLGVAGTGFT